MSRTPNELENKYEFMRWMIKKQSHRASVPRDLSERSEVADRCAKIHQEKNRSDPFAYGRAHASVMIGILDENDFRSGPISL